VLWQLLGHCGRYLPVKNLLMAMFAATLFIVSVAVGGCM